MTTCAPCTPARPSATPSCAPSWTPASGPATSAILCLYDLDDCTGGLVIELVKTHPLVMIDRLVVENPWYVSPEDDRAALAT